MPEFKTEDWQAQHQRQSKGLVKRLAFHLLRPLLSWKYSRYLTPETLKRFQPRYCLGSRGMPLEYRRTWGSRYVSNLQEAVLLVQGTGTGWDVVSWASLRPRRIIAVDLFSFQDSWDQIRRFCGERYRVEIDFRAADLEDLSFLEAGSIDFIGSDAVYEHCRDLPAVIKESYRVLSPGGSLYASYGPLYFCAGGDHFSGRGGLNTSYNHLVLEPESYRAYVRQHTAAVEDVQEGARYLELGLFSYLTTEQYLQIFREANFGIKELILEISEPALKFQRNFPWEFRQVLEKCQGKCALDDLLIKAHLIILQKPY